MKLVLMSGGSGKRLWPLSNDARSKQFLKVLPTDDDQVISMLQRVWGQLQGLHLAEHAYLCTSRAQVDIIESQIGDVPIIVEPERRDTFPAIALACSWLLDVEKASEDEFVFVLPVDHYVEPGYFTAITELGQALSASQADIALLGVEPTFPTSKYGYIRLNPSSPEDDYLSVQSFVEKPSLEIAEQLLEEGALWNCGIFCFQLGYLRGVLKDRGLPYLYEDMLRQYSDLPQRSFDYEVVEHARAVIARPYSGLWKDLGSWEMLAEEMKGDFTGIGTAFECEESHVINELGIPVITMGLHGTVVVASPDGILVAEKGYSGALKDVVKPFSGRPMYEERFWGSYRVLDYSRLDDGTEVLVRTVELLPGRNLSYQRHAQRTELWSIIEGSGELALGNRMTRVEAGDVVQVFPGQWHAVRADERLVFIEVQRGISLDEEDIVRRYEKWEDIQSHCALLLSV